MSTQNLAEEHARQHDVVGKLRLTGALRAHIDFAKGLADYTERLTIVLSVFSHNDLVKIGRGLTPIRADQK